MPSFDSIQVKITAPLAAFILFIAVFTAVYFPQKEAELITAKFHERLRHAVDILSLGTSISISSGSLEGAEATVRLLKKEANLAFLKVFDPDQSELISDGQIDEEQLPPERLGALPEGEFVEIGNFLMLKDRIEFDDEHLGYAIIGLDTTEREELITRSRTATLVISLGLAIIGIGVVVLVIHRVVLVTLRESAVTAERIATGDLTVQVDVRSGDEMGKFQEAVKSMAENLNSLIGQTQRSGIQITRSVTQIAASGKQLEATVTEQAASTNQVVATAKEISATSQDLASTMKEVSDGADGTVRAADAGQQGLGRMQATMSQMEESTHSISSKLGVINERAADINSVVSTITKVADQTNLLSLNAAIEAEKAGEYGVGFAVVAREIRRLADQTAVATLDIEQTVKEMSTAVSAGVMSMDKFSEEVRQGAQEILGVGSQLSEIIEQVQALIPRFASVEQGMDTQSQGAQQISESMVQLNDGAQQTAESLRETNRALEQLTDAAHALQKEISHFRIA